jgi:Ca-activated chloride channel family protein
MIMIHKLKRSILTQLVLTGLTAAAIVSCGSTAKNTHVDSPPASTPATIAASATPVPPTAAAEPNNILFIVDSSGSMKAKAGSKTRMEAAKEVVSTLVSELPAGINAGLMAYGHRRKNDCTDVELIMNVGPVDRELFSTKVRELQPFGETPISFSIRQAADVLKSLKGKRSIILISDGEESCNEDPCAVAADLKKANVDLKVHVVGFGLDKPAAKKQLSCIADATGGLYKEAADAAQLKTALEGIAASSDENSGKGRLVSVIPDSNGSPLAYGVEFFRPGTTNENDDINDTLDLGPQLLRSDRVINLSPGIYDIHYGTPQLPGIWKRNVEIKAGEETRVVFEQFGRIRITLKDQTGAPAALYAYVYPAGGTEQIVTVYNSSPTQELPAGSYDIKFWGLGYEEAWVRGIVVRSGQETPVELKVTKVQ